MSCEINFHNKKVDAKSVIISNSDGIDHCYWGETNLWGDTRKSALSTKRNQLYALKRHGEVHRISSIISLKCFSRTYDWMSEPLGWILGAQKGEYRENKWKFSSLSCICSLHFEMLLFMKTLNVYHCLHMVIMPKYAKYLGSRSPTYTRQKLRSFFNNVHLTASCDNRKRNSKMCQTVTAM